MTDMNKTWMGQTLNVVTSTDATLIGRSGLVVDETQHTVTILEHGIELSLIHI